MRNHYWILLSIVAFLSLSFGLAVACGDDDDDNDDSDADADDDVDDDVNDDVNDDVDDDVDDDTGDDFDCRETYDGLPANQCIGYSSFEYYGCTEDDITDPACYIACLQGLEDGEWLCYEAEVCLGDCSDDDATGCQNAYFGMPNAQCVEYKEYYRHACDPRITANMRNCYAYCFENQDNCDDFVECVMGCEG